MAGTVKANGLELVYDQFGREGDPPLLLVMGLGAQLVSWPPEFCQRLADQGFFVTRYDNRDIGLSTHLDDAGAPSLEAALGGDRTVAPYVVEDMADDAAGLLDALGLAPAHVVGVSMGGMIAQALTIHHPDKVRSLTSIMSTPSVAAGPPSDEALAALLHAPPTTKDEAVTMALADWRVIGSPGFPFDEERIRRVAVESWDRNHDPVGRLRQLVAILCSPDRAPALAQLRVPTLVVHGAADPLVNPSGGRATAEAVPGAELLVIDGMGHDLPVQIWDEVIARITAVARRAGG